MSVKSFNKDQQVITLMLGLAIFFTGIFRPFHPFWPILRPPNSDMMTEPRHQSVIEVSGAVKNPGIYTFDKPPTAYQTIQSIGGPTGERPLSFDTPDDTLDTGMRIELHGSNPQFAQLTLTPMSSRKRLVLGVPVRLNQARVEDLAIIPGISHGLARRIVEFRESHGPFKTWNNLRCVKGIGPKKVKSLQSYLSLK
ncbi:MAG: helix-hairpin-helix domain-containing protein [Deltaproteobacteria bacterium]|nr:helix-hairpin-helix domain-containing protein [Deltaproteobacteria bacterium]